MDANKRLILIDNNYRIGPCCGLCVAGLFNPGSDFGSCIKITYEHAKHTTETRHLSVNRAGVCDKFERNDDAIARLEKFDEFLTPDVTL